MRYAVVRRWKDNPGDLQVIEYVETIEDGRAYIQRQKKSHLFTWEVMKYVSEIEGERP